jgi:hypothetical protein
MTYEEALASEANMKVPKVARFAFMTTCFMIRFRFSLKIIKLAKHKFSCGRMMSLGSGNWLFVLFFNSCCGFALSPNLKCMVYRTAG